MRPFSICKTLVSFCLIVGISIPAMAREQIRVVGSSTVFPFTASAAEQFGLAGKFKTPIVESTGTGGGFKLFCSGVGEDTPDISGASRPIKDSEVALCAENGVHHITEIAIGYDGIVIANAKGNRKVNLTKEKLFLALAAKVPGKDGTLIVNPYQTWNEIDPALPKQKIEVYGPPPTSGTRDAFVEMVMEEGCHHFPAFEKAIPDKKERQKKCGLMREDGGYIDAGEDDNVIVQKITANPDALGIFGYSFLMENEDKVQANQVGGVIPTAETLGRGEYGVARSLFIYVKGEHVGVVPGIQAYVKEILSNAAIGKYGYLIDKGLIPLLPEALEHSRGLTQMLPFKKVVH